jgi:hypothetical protein
MSFCPDEEVRQARISVFYMDNPGKVCCDRCCFEISEDQFERSQAVTGLRFCGICLTLYVARGFKDE